MRVFLPATQSSKPKLEVAKVLLQQGAVIFPHVLLKEVCKLQAGALFERKCHIIDSKDWISDSES